MHKCYRMRHFSPDSASYMGYLCACTQHGALCECTGPSPWFYVKDQGFSLYFNHSYRWTSLQEWFSSLYHKYQKFQSSNCLKSATILHWNSYGNFSLSLLKGHHSMFGTFLCSKQLPDLLLNQNKYIKWIIILCNVEKFGYVSVGMN